MSELDSNTPIAMRNLTLTLTRVTSNRGIVSSGLVATRSRGRKDWIYVTLTPACRRRRLTGVRSKVVNAVPSFYLGRRRRSGNTSAVCAFDRYRPGSSPLSIRQVKNRSLTPIGLSDSRIAMRNLTLTLRGDESGSDETLQCELRNCSSN